MDHRVFGLTEEDHVITLASAGIIQYCLYRTVHVRFGDESI